MNSLLSSFFSLFYPRLCAVCDNTLVTGEKYICTRCRHDFPDSHGRHTRLELLFSEVCRIGQVSSLFYYKRESSYKQLIYAVKYHGNMKLGFFLGEMLGKRLKGIPVEIILPVPLHPRRQRERGFNQSGLIARGVSSVLQLPVREDVLRRVRDNISQTRMKPAERAKNVEGIFSVDAPDCLENKHVLLVDDVTTTGATLYNCLKALGTVPGIRVSVACLARAGSSGTSRGRYSRV